MMKLTVFLKHADFVSNKVVKSTKGISDTYSRNKIIVCRILTEVGYYVLLCRVTCFSLSLEKTPFLTDLYIFQVHNLHRYLYSLVYFEKF